MVTTLFQSSLREIRQSLGRYVAIMAIVALGVGIFGGLRMCEPDMKETGVRYLGEHQLYDFRLLSTLGFTQEDEAYFAGLDTVQRAEGSVYTEFLCRTDSDEDSVLIAHMLTEGINEPKLEIGRMPEKADECLGDANLFTQKDIGRTIRVSPSNDEDTLELLAYDEYTIVGIARSPLYLNYERGTASIGNGSISAFLLIPEEGFTVDAFYEIFLTVRDPGEAYSEEYQARIDELKETIEDYAGQRGDLRYTTLYNDAMEEIREGEEELEDGWAEYNDGLADLEEGKREYADGLQEYEDGVAELADAEQELADGWQEYEDAKADVQRELSDAKQTLEESEKDYASALAAWEEGAAELEEAKGQLDTSEEELSKAKEQLDQGIAELDAAKEQLDQGAAALSQAEALYQAGQGLTQVFLPGATVDELLAAAEQDPVLAAQLDYALQSQGSSLEQFKAGWSAAGQAMGGTLTREGLDAYALALEQGKAEYEAGKAEYESNLALYEAGRTELDAGWAEYESGKQAIDAGKAELDSGRTELDRGWSDYYSGKAQAERELDEACEKLKDGEAELEEGRAELADAEAELDEAAVEIADAETELAEAEQELLDGEAELEDAYEELDKLKEPDIYTLTRNENVGYASFDNDTNIVRAISVVFPVFFFLVAALVCMTTMTRMVDEQRTQIGVLKALGYSDGQVLGKYLFYAGSAAVTGTVAGYAIGSVALPWVIWEIYRIMYNFADLEFVFDPVLALLSFAAAMLCSMGVTFLACRLELSRQAAELIRPKTPKAGKRVFLEYVTPLWKRLSFLQKVSVRNVLRYRSRLVMMLLGIGGCTALLITGFGIRDSVASIADQQYDTITLYDLSVTFEEEQTQEQAAAYLAEAGYASEEGLLVWSGNADVVTDREVKSAHLIVSSESDVEGFVDLKQDGMPISYPEDGQAVLDIGLAQETGLQVGDTVELRDDDLNSVEVTVSGICDNYIEHYVYITPGTFREQTGDEPEYKTLFVQAHDPADPYAESVELSGGEGVSSVTMCLSFRERVNSMLSRMDYIVVVVVICAAALAFVVLYNLTNINISERIREIATIKVLGFYHHEVSTYVFRETHMLSVLGSIVGIGLGKLLHWYVMEQVKVDGIYFPTRVELVSYGISIALTIVFTVLITRFMRKKLKEVDMAESLKSIE